MNKRTQILAIGFGVVVAYLAVDRVAYPVWIKPLLTIDEQIAKRGQVLQELEQKEADVEHAKRRYEAYAQRVGYMDVGLAKTDLRKRLTDLLNKKHKLANANVDKGRVHTDRKKGGIHTITLGFSGDGPLESVIKVLQELAELPDLMQVTRVDLTPSTSKRRLKKKDQVSLSATLQVKVLPQQKLLGKKLTDEELKPERPAELPRHRDFAYATIWQADPFSEYERYRPKPEITPVVTNDDQEPPPPPPPPTEYRWEDRSRWELHMALLGGDGTTASDEVQLVNTRDEDERRYAAVGDDLDGGIVLCVHHRGVLVGREDGDFVYPIGARLDEPVRLAEAAEFPELQAVAERLGPRPERPAAGKGSSASPSRPVKVSARPERDKPKMMPRRGGSAARPPGSKGKERSTAGKGKISGGRDKPARTPAVKRRRTPSRRPTTTPSPPEPDDEIPDE